jgi:hypothetical protein
MSGSQSHVLRIADSEIDVADRHFLSGKDAEMIIRYCPSGEIPGDDSSKVKHNIIEMKCFWWNRKRLLWDSYSRHLGDLEAKLALLSY